LSGVDNEVTENRGMNELEQLAALHKHWVTADSINYHLGRSMKGSLPEGAPKEFAALGQMMSAFAALGVWYSLLYVVVEGYRELGYHDAQVDTLLANDQYVTALRLFRNATFHYQTDPLSPKLLGFLEAKDSETWIKELNRALKDFLERELKLGELLQGEF
jgi:hypothetical protein